MDEKENALIVSDDFTTKIFFKKNLTNFYIIEKRSSIEAINIAENTILDIVIIDDRIEDAIDLCFQLKKRKRLFTVPIILITSRLKKTYLQSAQKAGVFDFLFLPLDETKLIQILQKCQEEKKRIKKISSISFKLNKDS